jgi:hypothetical protein
LCMHSCLSKIANYGENKCLPKVTDHNASNAPAPPALPIDTPRI